MEDIKFLKIFVLSLINLLSYLLSIYFLTSLYYTKLLTFYFQNDGESILSKYYQDISVSFSFHTITFIAFNVSLFIIIFRSNLSSLENDDDQEDKFDIINKRILLIVFFVCQFFYLLDLILISVNLKKIKSANLECIFSRDEYVKSIYKDVLIIGYIFLIIFIIMSVLALIFTEKKFNFLQNLSTKKCNCLEDYFTKKINNTPEILDNEIKKMDQEIENLRKYKSKLENGRMNSNEVDEYEEDVS